MSSGFEMAQTDKLWYRKTTGNQRFPTVQGIHATGDQRFPMVQEDHRKPTVSYGTRDICHRLTVYATKTPDFLAALEFCVEVFAVLLDGTGGVFGKAV